jgi:hypothetical protein
VHDKDMPSISAGQLSALFCFYLILELLPIAVVQSFYYVQHDSRLSEKPILENEFDFEKEEDSNDYDLGSTSCAPHRESSKDKLKYSKVATSPENNYELDEYHAAYQSRNINSPITPHGVGKSLSNMFSSYDMDDVRGFNEKPRSPPTKLHLSV